ncbi:hypothetical protein C440_06552 [Haloferax mucosum ATCC BAA-1512]|uniref:Uncharacterized protein n=1 Tax=Haloferax mucosum ATCC BAA-1512 TaxID=662479 RepID=M0IKE3_9EURY|nr:hypothetical protein [Haloferax mucosum]ELZ95929.1 hypothetical protein C440_06552 [Haloferax mucosum ATCC BAA-1512]
MAENTQQTKIRVRLFHYLLILFVLYLPLVPYWYLRSGPTLLLNPIEMLVAVVSGSLLLFGGVSLIERFVNTSAKSLVALNGVGLGFGLGASIGHWVGIPEEAAVFPGLFGSLVLTVGLFHVYERYVL